MPLAPVRRLIKTQGVNIVQKEAVIFLVEYIEDLIKQLSEDAIRIMKSQKRKTLYKEDFKLAVHFSKK